MADKAVVITGMDRLTAKMNRWTGQVRERVAVATTETAKEVYAESQRRVPVDTGNLKASGRVTPATPDDLTATDSYGGTAAGYAVIVHETHKTKSKFLEAPAREASKDFKERVKEAARYP